MYCPESLFSTFVRKPSGLVSASNSLRVRTLSERFGEAFQKRSKADNSGLGVIETTDIKTSCLVDHRPAWKGQENLPAGPGPRSAGRYPAWPDSKVFIIFRKWYFTPALPWA